jgi:signal transduction histidine kinase
LAELEIIAVVDDTEGTRFALRRTFERAGYRVIEGANGADALRIAVQQPSLIVLDIHLPDALGSEIARRIKADPATAAIPILHLSASATDEASRALGLNSGADAYLAEPVEPELLLATVRALLRRRGAERVVERALQTRDEVMAIASHDVRGMLQALRMSLEAQLLRAQGQVLDQAGLLLSLQRCAADLQRMSRTMEDLLDRSQLDAGQLRLQRRDVDAVAVIEDAVERWRDEATATGSTLTMEAREAAWGKFDDVRLGQIVSNLVSNAFKYGGGKPIHVAVTRADGAVEIAVTDQGVGIDPQEQQRIFDRYQRAESPRAGSYGLGLWIARELARLHGGAIEVESMPGKGATFRVRLPLLEQPL